MKKFRVWGIATASVLMGVFEAEDVEAAIELAENVYGSNITLCHQCSNECEVGDMHKFQADEVGPDEEE